MSPREIVSLYRSGLSTTAVARRLGCSQHTVWYHLKRQGCPRLGPRESNLSRGDRRRVLADMD